MKKYVKPDLYYEDFQLSVHIAACAWDMSNSSSPEVCSAISDADNTLGYPADVVVFTNKSLCAAEPEYYCYTNGTEGFNIFNS